MDRFLTRLVQGVAALVLAIDPQLVVIGGWAAGSTASWNRCANAWPSSPSVPPRVLALAARIEVVAMGALLVAADQVEDQLFAVDPPTTGGRA